VPGFAKQVVIPASTSDLNNDWAPFMPRDLTMLHGPCLIGYLLDRAQLGVPQEDHTDGPEPWTTCLASAA
jgi:hypothetical protein